MNARFTLIACVKNRGSVLCFVREFRHPLLLFLKDHVDKHVNSDGTF